MKTSVKHPSDTTVVLTISVGADELKAAEHVAVTKLAKDVKAPGFRKGKVPASVAAKHIDPAALQEETLNNALSKAVAEAFTSEKIQAIDRPAVEVKKYVPRESLEFTAETEIIPKVTLGDYKKLSTKTKKETVGAKEVNEIIERMRSNFAEKKAVKRAAKNGDEVVIDFVGKKDDVAFEGGTATDYSLKLGDGQFIPGFEDGVVGHKPGDQFDLDLSFPDDYHVKDLAGAKVVFSVTLKAVNEVVLPEVNDEFAAKCGPFTSADELKKDIKRELTAQKDREASERLKDELVGELVEKSTVPIPEGLLKDQERSVEQDFSQNLQYRGMTLDMYLEQNKFKTREEWLDKEVKPVAERRVQAGLLLAELSKELKIDVTRDELDAKITEFKQQYANNKQMLSQLDSPDVHRDIANRMITDKTVDKLVELNDK